MSASSTILNNVDINQWRLEVERVTPMLKITIGTDNKDWRVHLQQLQHYSNVVNGSVGDVNTQLDRLNKDIETQLEKVTSREKYINQHFDEMVRFYKTF